MGEMLTREQIFERYVSEWVLLGDPDVDEKLHVLGGTVLYHSRDREEVARKAIEVPCNHIAFLYTGTLPPGTAILI